MPFTTKKRIAFCNRRAERYSKLGREQEQNIYKILAEAQLNDSPIFSSVVQHEPNGPEDKQGKDLTVGKMINGQEELRSFGITISIKQFHKKSGAGQTVPQFCFPIGIKPETVIKKVLGLFAPQAP